MTIYAILGFLAVLVGLAFVLIKAANIVVSAIHSIIKHSHLPTFGIAAFLVALSTSLPELLVAITASQSNDGELALGNILGSNIANISLILGGAALVAGLIRANDELIKKQVFYTFLIGSLPMFLLLDGNVSRIEGVALCLLYVVYIIGELRRKRHHRLMELGEDRPWKKMLLIVKNHQVGKSVGLLIVGMAGMIFAADSMVRVSHALAVYAHIPEFIIGLFIIAIGTSLPELAFEIAAIRNHQASMAFANIMGSIIINATLVLGIAAIIRPITLSVGFQPYLISNIFFLVIFAIFWRFVWTKHRLDRWEGGVLVLIYFLFALIQYVSSMTPLSVVLP